MGGKSGDYLKGLPIHIGRKTRGIIAAIDLNTAKRHEFPVVFSEILLQQAKERALKLWNAMQSRTEPEGEISDCATC